MVSPIHVSWFLFPSNLKNEHCPKTTRQRKTYRKSNTPPELLV